MAGRSKSSSERTFYRGLGRAIRVARLASGKTQAQVAANSPRCCFRTTIRAISVATKRSAGARCWRIKRQWKKSAIILTGLLLRIDEQQREIEKRRVELEGRALHLHDGRRI